MSRTQSITRGNITKVCDALAFLHSDESSSSWRVNESESLHSWHVNEGFVILPHHPAEAAADFLNEFCFGVVFLKESSKFHELNRSSICHELSESHFITSRTQYVTPHYPAEAAAYFVHEILLECCFSIDWFWLPIFRTNLVCGPWNKELKSQNKGTVVVQIAPLFI